MKKKAMIRKAKSEYELFIDDSEEFVPLDLTEEECDKIIEEESERMKLKKE